MKHLFFLLTLLVVFCSKLSAQEIPPEHIAVSKVPNDYELTDKQYSAWKSIKNNWMASDYELIESENKIKLNCKSCESFYIEVELKVNASGKLEYYKLISGKRCGMPITKQLELRMMRNFFKFEYPSELRNVSFKTRLGNVLKC
ncbi:MAG TPA: hypothetical protein VGC65_05875 [Bacteroidia bacterium]|jgi:hypothetical protein